MRKILLVEDNADDEMLMLRALNRYAESIPVVVARDGAEAMEFLLGDRREDFNLVLLDLRLPKVPGLSVLECMRADAGTQMTPVVILSSSRQDADIIRAYSLGANSYVRKPVDLNEFMDAMATVCRYWLVLNEQVA